MLDFINYNIFIFLVVLPVVIISVMAIILKLSNFTVKPSETFKLPKFKRADKRTVDFINGKLLTNMNQQKIIKICMNNNQDVN